MEAVPYLIVNLAWISMAASPSFVTTKKYGWVIWGWLIPILSLATIGALTGSHLLIAYRHAPYLLAPVAVIAGIGFQYFIEGFEHTKRTSIAFGFSLLFLGCAIGAYPPPSVMGGFQEGTSQEEFDAVLWINFVENDSLVVSDHRLSSLTFGLTKTNASWENGAEVITGNTEQAIEAGKSLSTPQAGVKQVTYIVLSEEMKKGVALLQWDPAEELTIIFFATPPMVRLTLLGLRKVPPEVIEAGKMSGCNDFQLLFQVLIPTARRDILIGVNQVIMQCLAMAVIASFIGARGLGWNLLLALNQLRIGLALEAGVCISLIAVLLDKMSLAWANKQTDYFANLTFLQRHKYGLIFVGAVIVGLILASVGSLIFKQGFNYLYEVPHNKGISTEAFWNAGVDWVWDTFFYPLKIFNTWLIVDVLQPMRAIYLRMPIVATFVLVMGAGYIIGGIRSALVVGGFTLFIALSPWWDRALVTAYMATFGVIVSVIIGTIVGSLCAQHKYSSKFIIAICDILQTFPSFVYLIPVMMLFGVTDTSVLIAVIIYATIPATRYTVEGLSSVPQALHDAGSMSGVTRLQRLFKIEYPLAFPHIMLGINQTVVFALFMVIIGAMIGTEDLGQYILKALSDLKGGGKGLILGLCVAFIGLAVDNLIRTWAEKRKILLGIS